MTEEEIRADERRRVAQRIEAAAVAYQAQGVGGMYLRGVRMGATIALREGPTPRLALVKAP